MLTAVAVTVIVLIRAQEAFLDKSQQRREVTHSMRNIMRPGEGRHRHKGNAEPQLIKAGALIGERSGRVCRESRAECFLNIEAEGALRSSTWLLAGGWVGEIGTASGIDSIGRPLSALARARRRYMVVGTSVLVVGDEDDGILPEWPV